MRIRSVLTLVPFVLLFVCPVSTAQSAGPDGVVHQRVAFVTNAARSAIFGDWPEATMGLSGLEAADSICVNRASAAGLLSPGEFVAWLSDSEDDAYCRLHGLTGKKSSNCGEPSLPEAAGPWVRTDGIPWAEDVAKLTMLMNPEVYTPLWLDENANPVVPVVSTVWTGTSNLGTLNVGHCMDWTAAPIGESTAIGFTNRTVSYWSGSEGGLCTSPNRHLYCLEKGTGPALDLEQPTGRIAFITSVTGPSNLGSWDAADPGTQGIDAADSICVNRAGLRSYPSSDSFRAWISDEDTDARDRFVNDGPWHTPDGIPVAQDLADLTDGDILAPINQGFYSNHRIWTGTDQFGARDMDGTCGSWTGAAGFGKVGQSDNAGPSWTAWSNTSCQVAGGAHLYCLSDALPGLQYADGFED
jgi:hypothetical protein